MGVSLAEVWKRTHSLEDLNSSIYSHLKEKQTEFYCSTKGDKMLYLDLYPSKFRKFIEQNQLNELYQSFNQILTEKQPKLDIGFDLFEWIFTGFDLPIVHQNLLYLITNKKYKFDENFLSEMKIVYENHFK
jgi:hypothetical protein